MLTRCLGHDLSLLYGATVAPDTCCACRGKCASLVALVELDPLRDQRSHHSVCIVTACAVRIPCSKTKPANGTIPMCRPMQTHLAPSTQIPQPNVVTGTPPCTCFMSHSQSLCRPHSMHRSRRPSQRHGCLCCRYVWRQGRLRHANMLVISSQ